MENLKHLITQEDTVIFVGSGISLWSGLPTWTGLLEELARFLERQGVSAELIRLEIQRGDLLQAASYGFDKLTKQQIGEFIRSACRYGVAKPHEVHRKIVSLGPRCFITTNYDDLIEQSLRKWQAEKFFRPAITNRLLTEMAEIVQARAIDFVFKPHGDASDSDSIILTREQYRLLLPQGERHAALEATRMLLASRPILYLGFGLRDPDFLYVRDLLANTYKGGIRDHYAIMADVNQHEIDYWRRNYGIHLINYTTTERPDKSKDHSALLNLLDQLLDTHSFKPSPTTTKEISPNLVLTLARHAAALSRTQKLEKEFPIRVASKNRRSNEGSFVITPFENSLVDKFLDAGPERAILTGLPGAGKSYSLRQAAARLADWLHEMCLVEDFNQQNVVVPIFVDLKLYRGNLVELINRTLPNGLSLDELNKSFKVKIFIDSFNEMPREYWESGFYEADFEKFAKQHDNRSIIIGSRTSDGLKGLNFPIYSLEHIEKTTVENELERLNIKVEGRFSNEMFALLQRPFYFQYVTSGKINLPTNAHPRDFYSNFFENVNKAFQLRFGLPKNLENALSTVAYEALNCGEEAFPSSNMFSALDILVEDNDVADNTKLSTQEIINWLIAVSILVPYSGNRLAFIHQSVTEYLAAKELAQRYLHTPKVLREKLTLTRWDQALFLTLSLLPDPKAEAFLKEVINADFELALNAAKYLEFGREEVISMLLSEIPARCNDKYHGHRIEWLISETLPLSDRHEPYLRSIIINCGSILGAAAVQALVSIKGEQVKSEVLELLYINRSDFNLCANGVAPALKTFISRDDIKKINSWIDEFDKLSDFKSENDLQGFVSGSAKLLSDFDVSVLRQELLPSDEHSSISQIRGRILCSTLQDMRSSDALEMAGDLLLKGFNEAATSIYFISRFGANQHALSWSSFSSAHVQKLIALIDDTESWAIKALKIICSAREDLRTMVCDFAAYSSDIQKACLLYCANPHDSSPIIKALEELVELSENSRQKLRFQALTQIDIDWSGNEALFVKLLKLRDCRLADAIIGRTIPAKFKSTNQLDINKIDWWLDWMDSIEGDDSYWLLSRLGSLLANYAPVSIQEAFVAEFNKENSKYRRLIVRYILPYVGNLTTDMFSESTISFLFADLNHNTEAISSWRGHILGKSATEQFVNERLLPLVHGAKEPLASNLAALLKQAGERHGRRYLI